MKCHQVLTGAVNSGDNTYAVGSVEGIHFTVYSSGCDIVILAADFERVQIIPGVLHGNVQVNCVNASNDVGKIAACYGGPFVKPVHSLTAPLPDASSNRIFIFEPTPIIGQTSENRLDYYWIKTSEVEPNTSVNVLCWNIEGTKLLTGGVEIQLWQSLCLDEIVDAQANKPSLEEGLSMKPIKSNVKDQSWTCVWCCKTAMPIWHLSFSPDGTLFCSTGRCDRLVKIWYETPAKNYFSSIDGGTDSNLFPVSSTEQSQYSELSFSFVYIAHPRAVTGISWRKISKYMPKSSVANALVTSCRDNICRIWVQTLLPEDSLINVHQLEAVSNLVIPRSQTQRHRQKLLNKFKQFKPLSNLKRNHRSTENDIDKNISTFYLNDFQNSDKFVASLPSTFSTHDFHGFGPRGTSFTPGCLHFHLTASINAEHDIPLVPSLSLHTSDTGQKISHNDSLDQGSQQNQHHHEESDKTFFVINWLNNKEMAYTQCAEKILHEVIANIINTEQKLKSEDEKNETFTLNKFSAEKEQVVTPVHSSEDSSSISAPQVEDAKSDSIRRTVADYLDRKLEFLMREWNNSLDLLYSVHPLDGSLLIWLVEWLDEPCPSNFRQPQISFSSRIPNSIPLGDASTMSQNVILYSPDCFLDLKTVMCFSSIIDETLHQQKTQMEQEEQQQQNIINLAHKTQQKHNKQKALFGPSSSATPTLCMITKHNNGSLNLWKLTFCEKSNYAQLLSISHSKRVCGHRFRVNDVACHPILPLLLTTSHHNLPGQIRNRAQSVVSDSSYSKSTSIQQIMKSDTVPNTGFCSELILWKVEPVGPLLKSGGITELARINSLEPTAFANVAWIPTLLPSTSISNSPSACFVASDGRQLRIYQAVIDARSLLAEAQRYMFNTDDQRRFYYDSSDEEDETLVNRKSKTKVDQETFRSLFKIVSLQSTARPGCVIELNPVVDARHDWQNTTMLHVFQESLILGENNCAKKITQQTSNQLSEAFKDQCFIQNSVENTMQEASGFEEVFYLVVIEKTSSDSVLHMWKIVIYFPGKLDLLMHTASQDENDSSRSASPEKNNDYLKISSNKIKTWKVCTQVLSLPINVEIIHATPSAGHLSSSNIYPACSSIFLIATACSDNKIRFWRCMGEPNFEWIKWEMLLKSPEDSSEILLPGSPLHVSCAFSGRIACAFKLGHSYLNSPEKNTSSKAIDCRHINIGVSIYECQSTGGSKWVLEDTIQINRIPLLEPTPFSMPIISESDLAPLVDTTLRNHQTTCKLASKISSFPLVNNNSSTDLIDSSSIEQNNRVANIKRLLSVPSYTTIHSLKKIIAEQGNQFAFFQKSSVLLDWVSTEDGSHILTCIAGHKLILLAPILSKLNEAEQKRSSFNFSSGSILSTASTTGLSVSPNDFRMNSVDQSFASVPSTKWMILRQTHLSSADGLPPLAMQISWVREGILVVGMDNEILVFIQWKISLPTTLPFIYENKLSRTNKPLFPMVAPYPFDSVELPSDRYLKQFNSELNDKKSSEDLQVLNAEMKFISDLPKDFGLFESFRISSPVIPQYHPKLLMELLAFGKIHRVRAILCHLVDSLCSINAVKEYLHRPGSMKHSNNSFESKERSPRGWTRTRALSVAAQLSPQDVKSPLENSYGDTAPIVAEEIQLDYTEIASIRPLPLYALIQADEGLTSDKSMDNELKKNTLWNSTVDADCIDNFLDSSYKTQVEETLDEFLGNRTAFNFSNVATSKFLKQQSQNQAERKVNEFKISINFDQRKARLLTKYLTHSHLPGLTSSDQMHLLALADSLASFNEIDQADDQKCSTLDSSNDSIINDSLLTAASLDDCGLRYLLNMRQHIYLLKCLPLMQRKSLQKNGLGTHNIIWAFHSETQEELAQIILASATKIAWKDLKELGLGYWIRNNTTLKKVVETIAKAAFKAKNDPLDASLYYLAMKKKNLVWGLYRSIQDKKMTDFFSHDFSEDKWRKAALKNAYALMGKQRFEHSVSFFLLAGSLWDAVEVCLNKLEDLQLAMIIVRLYEGVETDNETLKKLLNEEVLGFQKNVQNIDFVHPDPFLRSMAYWTLGNYNLALSTLLESKVGSKHLKNRNLNFSSSNHCQKSFEELDPSVFNFYLYLRAQPLIIRRNQVAHQVNNSDINSSSQNSSNNFKKTKKSYLFGFSSSNKSNSVTVTPFERRLFFLTAYRHLQAGCPSLALEVLSRLPTNVVLPNDETEVSKPDSFKATSAQNLNQTMKVENSSVTFDWNTPTSNLFANTETEEFQIKFDDDFDDEKISDSEEPVEDSIKENIEKEEETVSETDIMVQQFKFISCLKILMTELSTLATGSEVDGGQLRYQLYVWLEKSVKVLKEVCNYHTFSLRSNHDRLSIDSGKHNLVHTSDSNKNEDSIKFSQNSTVTKQQLTKKSNVESATPSLYEILIADKEDFESKLERCRRRKSWLTSNEAFLRNLLSYCSLHGAQGGGLASVRMELILLLQELQQDRSPQQQLLSPLPLPSTLPLLTSSVASQKTVVADPIRHLQSTVQDILQTLIDINTYVHIPNTTNYSSLPDFLSLPPFMVSGTATTLISDFSQLSHQNYITILYTLIHILRDLGISLSSCVYQSLCDCDSVSQSNLISKRFKNYRSLNEKSFTSKHENSIASSTEVSKSVASNDEKLIPSTTPAKWPGVHSLQSMIVREKDEDLPKLHTLLCESFVAIYLSQLVYALTVCDSSIIYRLIAFKFDEKSWSDLFGGGAKKLLYVTTSSNNLGQTQGSECLNDGVNEETSSHMQLLNTLSKQRNKLHMKILEQLNQAAEAVGNVPNANFQNITNSFSQQPSIPTADHQRPTYREIFIPPQMSILNYMMIKPELPDDLIHLDYDSLGSDEESDNDDVSLSKKFKTDFDDEEGDDFSFMNDNKSKTDAEKNLEKRKNNLEYEIYAWCIIRLAVTKLAYEQLNSFLQVAGLEKNDLPTTSPYIHATLRNIHRWQYALQFYMNEFTNLPPSFLPNMHFDSSKTQGPIIQKYKSLLETNNTPFRSGYTFRKAAKRLWNFLTRQPTVQDIFIRYIFSKNRSLKLAREHGASAICNSSSGVARNEQELDPHSKVMQPTNEDNEKVDVESFSSEKRMPEPMRVVHKDQDNISAFCVNQASSGLIALSTPKEIQELNIKPLLEVCIPWLEEETELDILNLKQKTFDSGSTLQSSYFDFLLVQHPADLLQTSPGGQAFQKHSLISNQQSTPTKQTILIKRHKTETVRRLASHPSLPLYLSGGQDGSVVLWEWNHQQMISSARPAGTYAKVTHVEFNQQGNKFGTSDSDGKVALWQVSNIKPEPFFCCQSHNKTTSDFTFLNSSSVLMAAGQSTDHRNVVIIDTLLPTKKSVVSSFACHEHNGASSIVYAPLSQLIITGGKKGDIIILDMRQRTQRDKFQAHESAVKCIALEPFEEFFATGSADGDIKVWSLMPTRALLYSFLGEHARNTFFRNIGMGVSHIYIDSCGRLFSCGADGSLKMRHLPTVECSPRIFFTPTSPSNALVLFGENLESSRSFNNHINDNIF